jgi:hypothetical protein
MAQGGAVTWKLIHDVCGNVAGLVDSIAHQLDAKEANFRKIDGTEAKRYGNGKVKLRCEKCDRPINVANITIRRVEENATT